MLQNGIPLYALNMSLLTELRMLFGTFSTNMAPLTGLGAVVAALFLVVARDFIRLVCLVVASALAPK
jgi:hypothetical protein